MPHYLPNRRAGSGLSTFNLQPWPRAARPVFGARFPRATPFNPRAARRPQAA